MTTQQHELDTLSQRWADAERHADTATLDALTTPDFTLVGPLGFVLDKKQWLDRYRNGGLITHTLDWHDVTVRHYGDAAITIARQDQQVEYQHHPISSQLRTTHIAVRQHEQWLLAGIHLSTVSEPPAFASAHGQDTNQ